MTGVQTCALPIWLYVDCVCTLFCLQIVVDSMSACEEGDVCAGKVMSRRNHGILMMRVMSTLSRNKSTDNIIDARQAIHPCISNAPMFYYLHCFTKCYYYVCYMLVAKYYGLVRNLPSYQIYTSPIYTTKVST